MQVHNLTQGSPEWHAYRRDHHNASDAPVMLGCSPYKNRDALIAELATGVTEEVDAATQARFDAGHRFEELARPLAEEIIGEELAPLVGSDGKYSASFDGLTLMGDTAFEHKTLNANLRSCIRQQGGNANDFLPPHYLAQMEQQCMVSGARRVLFMASKWAGDELVEERHCWYTPDPTLRAEIVAGWVQLEQEVAAYVAPDAAPQKVVAEAVTALPTVFAQVTGSIALKDNLPEYEVALRDFIDHRLITKPESDQDFANLDLQIKALKGAEAALDASEEQALSQAEMLSAFKRQKDMLHKLTRDTRLAAEKLLAAEKERIKLEQVQRGQKEFAAHVAGLNARLGKPYMPTVPSDFPGAIKSKRTVDSLRDAVNTELARAKIAANEIADRIQINLAALRELASQHAFLFADTATIVLKAPEDLTILAKSRIAEHDAKEAARLEAERDRIRVEEQEKARREAEAQAEQREKERQAEIARAALLVRQEEEAKAAAAEAQARAMREKLIGAEQEAQAGIAEARATEALPAPLLDDLSALARDLRADAVSEIDARQVIGTAQRTAAAAQPANIGSANLLIGTINTKLGYIVNAAFLFELGFQPARIDGARRFYLDSDLPRIGRAIAQHTLRVTQLQEA